MKMPALPLVLLFLQACSQPAPQPKLVDFVLPGMRSDSMQFADFNRQMEMIGETYDIPQSDTMYCYHEQGGWGAFDHLCTIYRDSTGYKAAYSDLTGISGSRDFNFWTVIKPIDPEVWKKVGTQFHKQNFWAREYKFDCDNIDGIEYYIWAREGSKFRLVNWDDCENNLDSLLIAAKNIRDLCVREAPNGVVEYSIKNDCIHAIAYSSDSQPRYFTKNREIYFAEKNLACKNGSCEIVMPKSRLDSLKNVEIVEYGIDGSICRFRVSQIQKERN